MIKEGPRPETIRVASFEASALQSFLKNMPPLHLAIITTDLDERVTEWTDHAETLFGWSKHDVLGRPISELLIGPVAQEITTTIMQHVRSGKFWSGPFEARRRDGETISIDLRAMSLIDERGSVVGFLGFVVEQNDQLKKSLEELSILRSLAQHLDTVRHDEMRRIAGEFHDGFSQRLHRLIYKTAELQELGDLAQEASVQLREIYDLELELSEVMQGMWGSLRPPLLDDFGLKAALEHLAAATSRIVPFNCSVRIDDAIDKVSSEIGEVIVAIVQEGLTNVTKHAEASACSLEVAVQANTISITLIDDGRGIQGEEGFGRRLMRERIRRFSGSFTVQNHPLRGTILAARLPLG